MSFDPSHLVTLRDLALEHIEQGVCVFDRDQCLLYCNRRYAELYGLRLSDLAVGMSLRAVVDLRDAAGTGPDMPPQDYAEWRKQIVIYDRVIDTEVQLRDGRTLHIHHEPVEGGAWVATHHDVTAQRKTECRIRHLAQHDALTGLPNRARFTERLEATLARLRDMSTRDPASPPEPPARPGTRLDEDAGDYARPGHPWIVAVLFIDLDHFKDVNDTLGHAAGDELLRLVSGRITGMLCGADLLARLGGDEFAVLIERPCSVDLGNAAICRSNDIPQLARAVIDSLAKPFALGQIEARIGASIGIATCTERTPQLAPALLLRQADMALYRAKADGRSALRFFTPSMLDALHRRTGLVRNLRTALEHHQIVPEYQPLVDLRTGAIVGIEALARWRHPIEGSIAPAEFIPAAESAGLICRLGEQVLRGACAQAAGWRLRLAVNLSPEQVRRPGLSDIVADALAQSGLPPHLLELEITETLLLHDTAPTLRVLRQLRDMGVGIVLDDFGTGYCSLSYLDRFPFTKLKIDRSFVAKLSSAETAPAIIQAIVTMGHTFALRVSAEGVETQDQLEQLRAMGCDEVQGYLLGRPESARAIEARFGSRPA